MRRSRLQVRFEPACVVASPLHQTAGHAMSFIRRQYVIARLYTFDWWFFSLLRHDVHQPHLARQSGHPGVEPACRNAVAVNSDRRQRGALCRGGLSRRPAQGLVKVYFPHWEKASRPIQQFDIWANPLVELAHWMGVASAAVGRHILWRGIRYHVLPGGRVQEIIRNDAEAESAEPASVLHQEAA